MQGLVRYGLIPEVARCRLPSDAELPRGADVVVETQRGLQLGAVVQILRQSPARQAAPVDASDETAYVVVRQATPADQARHRELRDDAQVQFLAWVDRIRHWNVDVQLVDLEWTLDRSKLILYVLNERGPECTRLAIQAAAAGLGPVEVQPVSAEGLMTQPAAGGGCGSCGCHS